MAEITARKRKASTAAAVPADEVAKVKKAKKSPKTTEVTKPKKAAKVVEKKIVEKEVVEKEVAEEPVEESEEEEEEDDQTEALLKGFESDNEEEENAKEGGLEPGQEVPNALEKLSKKQKKAIKKAAEEAANDLPGVVYIGRIPHGFYEAEMKAYFSQFGDILKIRLSRNRRTGASKHYAWIQFESRGVAEIVAKTMDNYLLFNHILKVKLVPDEQLPEDLFKGANRRFKKVPWNKIEGRRLEQGAGEEQWEKRISKAEKKREIAAEKSKKIGYEFEAPKIKSAKGVSKKPVPEIESGEDELAGDVDAVMAIEAAPAVEEPVKAKKEKKVKKSKVVEETPAATITTEETTITTEVAPVEKPKKAKKEAKKAKKSKA
ncbi:hypothetical protein SS1G_03893 [Sclerotinia sclerotiorum 1980 UF-70]|uniref:RRM domain-containing protein n=2 Tax=Sclerotinia sclerotiorum (strain ATCC 18683 / 1980 / Ss-1) TaxID=665079 RepID=A7EF02_SCLS1|nr:hypothetical protein SS1G_03893 [Sclerotinia sclerotiorum 1980 UF-70]APA12496.1 hypothetical protein sscle_09g072660 [Sclerotinia sclerotiorum 1980 UF-70]EDO01418.1 hypothetical protein SS1G_03893 [Sclerotinia sclerotiorum 1980 UF-70]